MRSFPNREDAESFVQHTRPRSVRFTGRCFQCGDGCATSVPGEWIISRDLFGTYEVDTEPLGEPAGDRCGHDAVRWQRVKLVDGVYEDCGETCRDALGGECRCICLGASHGANHRVKARVLSSET